MNDLIKCPHCSQSFEPSTVLKEELRLQMNSWKKEQENKFKQREALLAQQIEEKEKQHQQQLVAQRQQLQQQISEEERKKLTADFAHQLAVMQQTIDDNNKKLEAARKLELDYLQKEQQLKNKEEEIDIIIQKKLLEERSVLAETLQKNVQEQIILKEQEFALQKKELEKQIEDNKKLVDELKRKQEQGSMQLQGETQELMLEELLKNSFPFDVIEEVGKGIKGADCIQLVRNQFGITAGKIIYESKRTKEFSNEWIEKLKADMRSTGADAAVIVTQTLPKDMDRFGEKQGVYICTFIEVRSVALLLRNAILKIYELQKSQENKGDKMVMLYDYLISNEFSEQWKAIREGFAAMKQSIQKEREAMEKLWKFREKQLEKVLLNAAHIKGSIEGIAGNDAINLNLLTDDQVGLLDM